MPLRRRDVDCGVAVVNQVEAPQQRHPMEQAVHPITPEVQQQERQQEFDGDRQAGLRYEARRLMTRERVRADRYEDGDSEAADQEQADVARPATRGPHRLALQDAEAFEEEKRD